MKRINNFFAIAFASAALFSSCSNDDDDNNNNSGRDYEDGTFVLNEGGFNSNNASVSFINKSNEIEEDIYLKTNGVALGDVAQSMGFNDDEAYIVVNNSNKIEVVNEDTMLSIATITTDISAPRYIVFEDNKGYVSNWGDPNNPDDDYIAVINTSSYTVETTIPVAEGPEALVEENGKLYVAHKGGYNYGNTISVINLSNNTVETTIQVADVPDTMEEEDNYLFVLSSGKAAWTGEETAAAITQINMSDNTIVNVLTFADGVHPSNLKIDDDSMYYTSGTMVYSKGLIDPIPSNALLDISNEEGLGIYGFEVEDGTLYIGDARDYSSAGKVYTYNASGIFLKEFTTGLNPNGFYFND